jgi:Zn-dependent peptidase ImmA (M78 family)/DNA-binding XRE family transcriptional regulator
MFTPGRLALARMRRRFTAKILAEKAGISPVTLSRIENGVQEPDDQTVEKLAKALAYPIAFFFMPDIDRVDPESASFRSMKAMTARERDAALASGFLALELADWVKTKFDLPEPDLLDLKFEPEPSSAARMLRQHWGIGEKPIGHLIKLLETKGVRVFSLAENTRTVDAFSYWRNGEPFIFLNTFKTAERSRFDAAHELGHLLLHRHGGPQGREAEYQADLFASSFLMPEADVLSHLPYVSSLKELISMKRRWGVSLAALVYRLWKLGRISDWQNRSFFIQIGQEFGDTEPNGIERERSAVWQMVLSELWRDRITRHHIADELNMPREEMDTLLFGLTGDPAPPGRSRNGPNLKSI